MFCKHDWKILSENTTESQFECAVKALGERANVKIPHQMCSVDRKFIQVVCCPKCGKIKRYVEVV
jgi:hypothetical protein